MPSLKYKLVCTRTRNIAIINTSSQLMQLFGEYHNLIQHAVIYVKYMYMYVLILYRFQFLLSLRIAQCSLHTACLHFSDGIVFICLEGPRTEEK